ncbi:uncharacterized protein LOC125900601 isoform X1 [Epinephelus fuscoguttatus]|uniref:uncharacterized protein LOC125900601 isoform X1 n=1 Tax=Epinephelus fuscoguttatus TaxID=293821 RepID=UPI0020D17E4F|nr:uncharacterized protein LOC125900601 isoform X1 [Epinephelus fuscoguttatus]
MAGVGKQLHLLLIIKLTSIQFTDVQPFMFGRKQVLLSAFELLHALLSNSICREGPQDATESFLNSKTRGGRVDTTPQDWMCLASRNETTRTTNTESLAGTKC